ncbi:hypothetical protein AAFF_G00075890 [Aldrovandia affinis]|uniref:Uncharacterized protein n=1 Tax=Aldrovandia affinis TaxID=143900 RepID=A0AAD7RY63_9TELE|nr:hypothetical protein AAFF_G00075890 [Aldrovandia affinis]
MGQARVSERDIGFERLSVESAVAKTTEAVPITKLDPGENRGVPGPPSSRERGEATTPVTSRLAAVYLESGRDLVTVEKLWV